MPTFRDDAVVLARNESYWGGSPKSDTLRIRIIPEPLTQAAEYESGHLSVVEVPVRARFRPVPRAGLPCAPFALPLNSADSRLDCAGSRPIGSVIV